MQKNVFKMVVGCLLLVAISCTSAFGQLRGLDRADAAKNAHKAELFRNDGIVAAGISSDDTGTAIVKVFTKRRGVAGIPARLDGVEVVEVFVGDITAWDDTYDSRKKGGNKPGSGPSPRDRYPRPVPIGVSVGTDTLSYCFAGTLGCRLKLVDSNNGNVEHFMLSNNHVFAEENAGTTGVDKIIQPGTLDNNCVLDPADQIGTLHDFVALQYNGSTNFVDAAIAVADPADVGTATPSAGWGNPTSTDVSAFVGQIVQKYGRTTGYTEGRVDAINVAVNVGYDAGTAYFENQIIIIGRTRRGNRYVDSSFSDSGDSGSLIVDSNRNPVGLLFAGNSTVTIGNPIGVVLDTFSEPSAGKFMYVDDGN